MRGEASDPRARVPTMETAELPSPDLGRCVRCRNFLFYQRAGPPKHPRPFYWCRSCGRRYAAEVAG
jgi:hypothetical protein